MIISASYKTDIPTFYGEWFRNRLHAGFCKMVNPYGGQIYTIDLSPEQVDDESHLGEIRHALVADDREGRPDMRDLHAVIVRRESGTKVRDPNRGLRTRARHLVRAKA